MKGKVVFTDGETIRAIKGRIYEMENMVMVENETVTLKIPLSRIFKIEYKREGKDANNRRIWQRYKSIGIRMFEMSQ